MSCGWQRGPRTMFFLHKSEIKGVFHLVWSGNFAQESWYIYSACLLEFSKISLSEEKCFPEVYYTEKIAGTHKTSQKEIPDLNIVIFFFLWGKLVYRTKLEGKKKKKRKVFNIRLVDLNLCK